MARTYAKLLLAIWDDPEFLALPAGAQRTYMLLVSQGTLSAAGVLPYQPRKWAKKAADTTPDDIDAGVEQLVAARFLLFDADTEEVMVRTFIRHDGGARNRNIHKHIERAIRRIESQPLRDVAASELARESVKHQRPDPEGDPPQGSLEDAWQAPPQDPSEPSAQGDAGPTCHLSPVTFEPDNQSVSPTTPMDAVIDAATDRLQERFPSKARSPDARARHRLTLRQQIITDHLDDITSLCRQWPEADPTILARDLDLGPNVP